MRVGLYRPVHVKTLRSQKRRVAPSTLPKTISERFPAASTLPSIRARRRLNCAPACSSPPLCRDGRRSKKQSICTGLSTVGLPRALKRQTSCKQGRCLASCDTINQHVVPTAAWTCRCLVRGQRFNLIALSVVTRPRTCVRIQQEWAPNGRPGVSDSRLGSDRALRGEAGVS